MTKSLAQIVEASARIETLLLESGGELSPQIEEFLNEVGKDLAVKADGYHAVIGRMEASAEFFKKQADQYYDAAKSLTNLRDRLKERIKFALTQMNLTAIEGESIKFSIRRSRPSLVISDIEQVPAQYKTIVQTVVADSKVIRTALEMGATIPGASLESGVSLFSTVAKKVKS